MADARQGGPEGQDDAGGGELFGGAAPPGPPGATKAAASSKVAAALTRVVRAPEEAEPGGPAGEAVPAGGTRLPADVAGELARLHETIRSDGGWLYWIAGLSLVNTVLSMLGVGVVFLFGLAFTHVVGDYLENEKGMGPAGQTYGRLLSLVALALLIGLGFFAVRRHLWAFIVGIVCYVADGLIYVHYEMYLNVAVDAVVLFFLVRGAVACFKANRLAKAT